MYRKTKEDRCTTATHFYYLPWYSSLAVSLRFRTPTCEGVRIGPEGQFGIKFFLSDSETVILEMTRLIPISPAAGLISPQNNGTSLPGHPIGTAYNRGNKQITKAFITILNCAGMAVIFRGLSINWIISQRSG